MLADVDFAKDELSWTYFDGKHQLQPAYDVEGIWKGTT